MISSLSGKLEFLGGDWAIINVGGIGFQVRMPTSTLSTLGPIGKEVKLHTHLHLREDNVTLYGFGSPEELALFQVLISVSGIGPKLAINILSGIAAGELVRAVTEGDLRRLTGIPGVGKKTAERMILELKDKAIKLGQGAGPVGAMAVKTGDQVKEDALSALVNLGYKGSAVKDVVDRIMRETPEPPSLDQLLKQALKALAG